MGAITQKEPDLAASGRHLSTTFLLCEDRGTLLAIPVDQILEIILSPHVCALPFHVDNLKGVINLRGEVLPVLDIDALMEMRALAKDSTGATERKYIIVLLIRDEKVALQIQRARRIVDLDREDFQDTKAALQSEEKRLAGQIVKTKDGNVIVLDFTNTSHGGV